MRNAIALIYLLGTALYAQSANPFAISDLSFDPAIYTFHLTWKTDTLLLLDNMQGGISVTCGKPASSPPDIAVYFEKDRGDTVFSIPVLQFDTIYYVQIWALSEGTWIKPDSFSTSIISVSSKIRQPLSFFEPSKSIDTVRALNGSLVLWKGSDYPLGIPPHEDTVVAYNLPDSLISGFISLCAGVKFLHPEPSLPLYAGFHIKSIPDKPGQVHIYRDSSGSILIEHNSILDKKNKMIYVKTRNLYLPFLVLADTSRPEITVLSDTSSCIDSLQIIDTIEISDNCANLSWSFFCNSGELSLQNPITSGVTTKSSTTIYCRFPELNVRTNGVRAMFTVSDGTRADTVLLSRRGEGTIPIF